MLKNIYFLIMLLALSFMTNCNPSPDSKAQENKNKPQDPPAPPLELSLDQTRKQYDALTMSQAIDEFNNLKKQPGKYTRKTLDNFVEALIWKSLVARKGVLDPNGTFKVSGNAIEIEEAPNVWKKIDTDIEDKRALLRWAIDRNLDINAHIFRSDTQYVKKLNLIEQAVDWDDLDFVKYYFSAGILGKDAHLNSQASTPLAFAKSVPMAQYLLDQGARADPQVRGLKFKGNNPVSVVEYLKSTKAPQAVINLVETY